MPREPEDPQRIQLQVDGGRLELLWFGWSELGRALAELPEELLVAALARRGERDTGSAVAVGDERAWVKGGRLVASSARRHFLRASLFGRPFPRLSEALNLAWLRARGIPAVRPLLAGLYFERGRLPRAQFLATEFQPGTALDRLAAAEQARYAAARASAGALLERMHAAGFAHGDAFERNFLIHADDAAIALDTWRGGPCRRLSARAIARDRADFERRG